MTSGVIEALERQRAACADAGSPFYATLLAACIADIESGGPVANVFAGIADDEVPTLLPLRFLGGVHRLVLQRKAPRLALHYSSVGGDGDAAQCWPAFLACVQEHTTQLRADLAGPPQTNDVGRSALLIGALHLLVERHRIPIRLFEIGSSAGLNLLADHFAIADDRGEILAGPADADVVLRDAWRGALPPQVEIDIIERRGCDLAPVDIATVEGRERLTSFVWPDDVARFERLRAALTVAATDPIDVEIADALDFVGSIELKPGTVTVLWHSVVTMYMGRDERTALRAAIDCLHEQADENSVFAHVWFEPRRSEHVQFGLRMQVGAEREARVVAKAPPHGLPTTWLTPRR